MKDIERELQIAISEMNRFEHLLEKTEAKLIKETSEKKAFESMCAIYIRALGIGAETFNNACDMYDSTTEQTTNKWIKKATDGD